MSKKAAEQAADSGYVQYAEGVDTRKSFGIYSRAAKLMPGGASSHGQCYPVFDPYPLSFDRGSGSRIWDVDGNVYIDYVLAMGPLIHGHAHPSLTKAVEEQLKRGTMFAALHEKEVALAQKVCDMTALDMVRFSNSGAEATQTAIRLARGHTGKSKIIKFEGAYHGGHDYVLYGNGGPGATGSPTALNVVPISWGIPEETGRNTLLVRWNDADSLEKVVKRNADQTAAIISEPVLMNIGTVPPEPGFLKLIRDLCTENGMDFILDEVITGFRLARGGAQEYFGVKADIATYAKALGAGFPISAIAGKREIMEEMVPGKVFHAGTYNANPLCVAASLASLQELDKPGVYPELKKVGDTLQAGLEAAIRRTHTDAIVQGVGPGGCQIYFTKLKKVKEYRDFLTCDSPKYMRMHRKLLKKGIYFHPQAYEHLFVSTQHTIEDVNRCTEEVAKVLAEL
jgi:glutamate-1-semialdehyde 2,1-aminomutase